MFNSTFIALVLTEFRSDVESLKDGIVKISKNTANVPYTILLVGKTGIRKSPLLNFIADVLGRDISRYDDKVLNEGSAVGQHSQTELPQLYEITSKNGILVSPNVLNTVGRHNRFSRFVSSTRLGCLTRIVLSKTSSKSRVW